MADDIEYYSNNARQEQEAVAEEATAAAVISGIKSVKLLATAAFGFVTAKQLKKAAENLSKSGAEPTFQFDPLDGGDGANAPAVGTLFPATEPAEVAAVVAEPEEGTANPFDPGNGFNPNFNTGELNTANAPPAGVFEEGNGGAGGGGSAPLPNLQPGGTGPAAPSGSEQQNPVYAGLSSGGLAYGSGGAVASGGASAGAGRRRGGGSGGPNLSNFADKLLAQFLPGNQEKKRSPNGILDFSNRTLAAARNTSPLHGRGVNLFTRVSKRYQKKAVQGAL